MSDTRFAIPGEWQAQVLRRLIALGYGGFVCGPEVKWWPIDANKQKVAGPFTSPHEFDEWLDGQERQRLVDAAGDLLTACIAQHRAIDILFATLMGYSKFPEMPFMPSKSGQPWEAVQMGFAAIIKATGKRPGEQ